MNHLEQIKEIIHGEIGRFATVSNYNLVEENHFYEEYEVSFIERFNPINIRAYDDGSIQVKVGYFYESTSTIDTSCCYLYIALMNAKLDEQEVKAEMNSASTYSFYDLVL